MKLLNLKHLALLLCVLFAFSACKLENENQDQNEDEQNNGPDQNGVITEDITSDRTLDNRKDNPNETDYFIEGTIEVSAKLTIEPGVRIVFDDGAQLNIEPQGSLVASGTANEPIVFTGDVENPGYWRGIHINSPSNDNILRHVVLKYGGEDYWRWDNGLLWLNGEHNGKIKVQNTLFEGSARAGLYAESGTALPEFQNNRFRNNQVGVIVSANELRFLDTGTVYNDQNESPYIVVNGNTVTQDQSWLNLDAPYAIQSEVGIDAAVTVNAGTEFRMEEDVQINVNQTGSLNAVGTASDKITFRGMVETHGYWRGIQFSSPSSDNALKYAIIADGADDYWQWGETAVWVTGAQNGTLVMENCEVFNNYSWGLVVESDASITPATANDILASNDFSNNGLGTEATCDGDCHVNLE